MKGCDSKLLRLVEESANMLESLRTMMDKASQPVVSRTLHAEHLCHELKSTHTSQY